MTMQARRSQRRRNVSRQHDPNVIRRRIIPAASMDPISSLLVYARNGVGKTRLAASASEIGKTLIIDAEKGAKSAKRTKAEIYPVDEWDAIDEVYWYLANQDHGYKFVALDPVSRMNQLALAKALRDKVSADLTVDPYQPQRQDWGKSAELMRTMLERFFALPDIFLILTAYEKRGNNDDEDADYDFIIGPAVQPAVKGFVMGQSDIIARLYIATVDSEEESERRTVERRLLTGPHDIYEWKDRSDNLPRVMRQPTMAKILERINRR